MPPCTTAEYELLTQRIVPGEYFSKVTHSDTGYLFRVREGRRDLIGT